MKRKIPAFAVLLAICLFVALFAAARSANRVIGTIKGAEWEIITIDGIAYKKTELHGFSSADKGAFLGIVTNGRERFRVYSVKGDSEDRYIYRLWGYDGAFYAVAGSCG